MGNMCEPAIFGSEKFHATRLAAARGTTSALHFRDLAVFGEQLLLSIRFGAWTTVIEPEQAANWARLLAARSRRQPA
jgi:hypothetical protein